MHLHCTIKFKLQVWVYGDSYQPKLVAVVHPKEGALKTWAKDNGKSGE